ncbi:MULTISPECIES: DUF2188 domain-containing protein [Cellulosilyticum]|uniref:DUF2188 domain-containing protein n=1 Tax=Cellulosilyticum lentocellum (strain ATCC 49066 / DSM 5427 / NCIMB 11756 / RHM5) TaxID=642492 RepID=F2JPK4_CELLD|nr:MULTISPECIES: DUF2188 domain-containing protein [Cellulosilyticum]ADZ82552.1 Protein of unknown function DUF2188 [Cellulosilyticum lentocellum DSM 5427]QEH69726.1 DUF2188 domain-containing protein [Cellulosilyticum sp. WCF-2]
MPNQHITPHQDGWQVKSEGSTKATKVFPTQQQAIDYGRDLAKGQKTELIIHGRDGKIRDKDSYGNDPCPPIDTKY